MILGCLLIVCLAGFLSITIFANNSVYAEENISVETQNTETNVTGTATLVNEGIFIFTNKVSFIMPSFDLYKIYENDYY